MKKLFICILILLSTFAISSTDNSESLNNTTNSDVILYDRTLTDFDEFQVQGTGTLTFAQMQQELKLEYNLAWYSVFILGSIIVIAVAIILNLLAFFVQITSMQESKYKTCENTAHVLTLIFEIASFVLGTFCCVSIWRFSLSIYDTQNYVPIMNEHFTSDQPEVVKYCFIEDGEKDDQSCTSETFRFELTTNYESRTKSIYYQEEDVTAAKDQLFSFYLNSYYIVCFIVGIYIYQFKFLSITSIAGFFSIGERQNKQPFLFYDNEHLRTFCSKRSMIIVPLQIVTWFLEYVVIGSVIFPTEIITNDGQLSLFNHTETLPDIDSAKYKSFIVTWSIFLIANGVIQILLVNDMIPHEKRKLFKRYERFINKYNYQELSFYFGLVSVLFHFFFNFILFIAFIDIHQELLSYNKIFLAVGICKSIMAGARLR